MKCNKCGNEVDSRGKFCNICGTPVGPSDVQNDNLNTDSTNEPVVNDEQNNNQEEVVKKPKNSFKTIGIIAVAIIAIFLVISALLGGESNENVEFVKNGHFLEYPEERGYPNIGWAFENFFDDTSWEGFTADTGQEIVEFNGKCLYLDEEVDCKIQFEIYEDSFEVYTIAFNKIPQNVLIMGGIIQKVMEDAWDDSNY